MAIFKYSENRILLKLYLRTTTVIGYIFYPSLVGMELDSVPFFIFHRF